MSSRSRPHPDPHSFSPSIRSPPKRMETPSNDGILYSPSRHAMESELQARPFCTCNWLHNAATAPEMPIEFNPEMNEFDLHVDSPVGKAMWRIRYCPSCGGRAPESLRDTFFAIITPEEQQRLQELLAPITSPGEALRVLGSPDGENHSLVYRHLSETADVVAVIRNGKWGGIHTSRKNIRPRPSPATTPEAPAVPPENPPADAKLSP